MKLEKNKIYLKKDLLKYCNENNIQCLHKDKFGLEFVKNELNKMTKFPNILFYMNDYKDSIVLEECYVTDNKEDLKLSLYEIRIKTVGVKHYCKMELRKLIMFLFIRIRNGIICVLKTIEDKLLCF